MPLKDDEIVQFAQLALQGRTQDVHAYLRKLIRKAGPEQKALIDGLTSVLASTPNQAGVLRDAATNMLPIDADSRLSLLREEFPVVLTEDLIFPAALEARLEQVVAERQNISALESRGLGPTRSLLFVGPPGVGKTASARWLAHKLELPLLVLDLATVMSSFLGKTGANIRNVIDYAKSRKSVLLLDEFDAIAKRRDDDTEIGELKRLVTVLLQEVDEWPESSLLIAATNHGDLLDPAVWRRFDDVLQFDLPSIDLRLTTIRGLLGDEISDLETWPEVLAHLWEGESFSFITRALRRIRRHAAVSRMTLEDALKESILGSEQRSLTQDRDALANKLHSLGISDRKIRIITGHSRDTLRKFWRGTEPKVGVEAKNVGNSISDRRRGKTVAGNRSSRKKPSK